MKLGFAMGGVASALFVVFSCGGGGEGSSGGTSGTSGSTPGGGSALDGTWDVTSYAGDATSGSSVTVTGGKMSGTVTLKGNCTRTLDFAIQGNSMTGSSTPGQGAECAGAKTITLAGTRTTPAPDSDTPWNGTWEIQGEGDKGTLTIAGLSATIDDFKLSVAGGSATGTGGSSRYNFVAKRR